jgi:hypothetical protein
MLFIEVQRLSIDSGNDAIRSLHLGVLLLLGIVLLPVLLK